MGSTGGVRALAGVLTAGVVIAQAMGCGSVAGGGSGQASGMLPYPPDADHEPTAAAASTGAVFNRALDWPVSPGRLASIAGQLTSAGQVDVYDIGPVYPGDHVHVEVLGSASLDAAVAVLDQKQDVLITNDDRSYYGGLVDPLAEAVLHHASARCYVAVAVSPKGATGGGYTLEVLLTEEEPADPPEAQHVYLNFDGADEVRIGSRPPIDVPVFDAASIDAAFAGRTEEVIDHLLAMVRDDYTGLNVYFRSSRDGPPPDGSYTTLHFGQFDSDLLGVAENIDEYNLDVSQEAVIFADTFAAFSVLDPSVEEISQALANVASHEAGHLLGLYHCADSRAVMDVTASLRQMLGDQSFMRAPLHQEYFPVGYQDALRTLIENVGGDLSGAKQAAAAQLAARSRWYDGGSGPPARATHVFGTCQRCVDRKAKRPQKHRGFEGLNLDR